MTPHSVTKYAPSYLLTGIPSVSVPSSLVSPHDYEADKITALENTMRYHEYNKKMYDHNKLEPDFKVGDFIYVSDGNKLNRGKLDPLRIGPYP